MKPKTKYEQKFNLNVGTHIGSSWEPNSIRDAANGYLSAAEIIFKTEEEKKRFFDFSNWFVVHHLSYIASELYIKSYAAKLVSLSDEKLAPDNCSFTISEWGHNGLFGKLPEEERVQLEKHLSSDHFAMLSEMSTDELIRGRYPYQLVDTTNEKDECDTFPVGNRGRKVAKRWIQFARALSGFRASIAVED